SPSGAARKGQPIPASPVVSIGLPTYNGARHLREAVESLLAQDHADFELLISDNASTDATADIAGELAKLDPRIRIVRQPTNIGPTANFAFVLRGTHGRYFMWAADDDRWHPAYVSSCLAALECNPGAAMATSQVELIDGDTEQPMTGRPPEL